MKIIDRLRLGLAVGIAKTTTALVRSFKLGSASVLPGEISRRIHPSFVVFAIRTGAQRCDSCGGN